MPAEAASCDEAESQLAVPRAAMERRDAAGAGRAYLSIQAAYPACPQAFFELGMLFDRFQQPGKAAEQFEKAVQLSPGNPRAYDYLALSLEPLGKFERAEWAYKRALEVNRGPLFDAFLDYNYGRFLMKLNRLQEPLPTWTARFNWPLTPAPPITSAPS